MSPGAPAEPVSRATSSTVAEADTVPGALRRVSLPPDYERAGAADEAVRRYEAARPAMAPTAPLASPAPEGDRTAEGGIPQARFLAEPDLTLGSGLLIADVSFVTRGEPDDYALDRGGRFRVPTTRFRVRLNGSARQPGLPVPGAEFDLFAERGFAPMDDGSGEAPRMLVVLGDHSMRPGFNLKVAAPLSADLGVLRVEAFGVPSGTASIDLMRGLQQRASRLPTATNAAGG